MATSRAQMNAVKRYEAENVKRMTVKLSRKTGADILALLERAENKQGLIKAALRLYMQEHPEA